MRRSPISSIQSDNLTVWQSIFSFLSGGEAWKTFGHTPSHDKLLARHGGILSQSRNSTDAPVGSIRDRTFTTDAPCQVHTPS